MHTVNLINYFNKIGNVILSKIATKLTCGHNKNIHLAKTYTMHNVCNT